MDKDLLFNVFSRKAKLMSPVLLDSIQKFRSSPQLYEVLKYSLSAGGKRVRPALLVMAGESLGSTEEELLPAAASYELLHNFTLMHEDLINRNALRRGKETVYKKFGESSAIVAGDLLFSLAYENLHALGPHFRPSNVLTAFNYFNQACASLAQGQIKEQELQASKSPRISEYYYVVDNKTSSLFSGAMKTGALLAGAGDEIIDAFDSYALSFGRAFQIKDDLHDFRSCKTVSGRPECDILKGKKSLLTIHALNHLPPKDARELLSLLEKPQEKTTQAEVARAMELVEGASSVEFAEGEAIRTVEEGREALKELPESQFKKIFEHLLEYSLERD